MSSKKTDDSKNIIEIVDPKESKPKQPLNMKIILICIGILICLIGAIYAFFMITYPWYEQPVKQMINAIQKEDENLLKNSFPDFIQPTKQDKATIKRAIADMETFLGDKVSISYKITKTEKVDSADLEATSSEIISEYGVQPNITDSKKLTLYITLKGDETLYADTFEINTFRFDDKWTITPNEFKQFIEFTHHSCEVINNR